MKTYTHETTSNPDIFRVVDRAGDWEWYYVKSLDTYVRGNTTILKRGYAKGAGFYEALKRATPEEWDRKLEAAGDKGDAVHQAIKQILAGIQVDRHTLILAENNRDTREMTDEEWSCILSFGRFWTAHNPLLIASEQTVAYLHHEPGCPFDGKEPVGRYCPCGWAGTLDAIIRPRQACGARCCKCEGVIGKVTLP